MGWLMRIGLLMIQSNHNQPEAGDIRCACHLDDPPGVPIRMPQKSFLCLRRGNDVDAAIPLPAGLAVLLADRTFFSVADDLELSRRDPDRDQIVPGGTRTPIAKAEPRSSS